MYQNVQINRVKTELKSSCEENCPNFLMCSKLAHLLVVTLTFEALKSKARFPLDLSTSFSIEEVHH